jgi:hypothetical protein
MKTQEQNTGKEIIIRYYHPINKKWVNWKSAISGLLIFRTEEEALKEWNKQYSVKSGIINKFKLKEVLK